jgi:DNA-binding PadR family transcriptional regulator
MAFMGELELLVLLAIHRLHDGAYGVTILDEIQAGTSRNVAVGSVYKVLTRLELKRWVRSRFGPPTAERGGRRKKLYALTPLGTEAAERALQDLRNMSRGWDPNRVRYEHS